ncbi:MAG: aminotransferase class I/II-fold pyridoxal phosphate-dependent enzyme, partial [Verrucomicrobia bacterium]|nr:aminotransferase class I/II-fold pyridoxal phosphate-dependent enzyme [Verrucomicrobiota bacterium]
MPDFTHELSRRLEAIREQGLYREVRPVASAQGPRLELNGRTLLNFSSNDYLGLANDPQLRAASTAAVERYGAGCGAARLVCGSLAPHQELEEALAAFKGAEAALSFSSGYATALGSLPALLHPRDVVVIDKLAHACLVDAARLSGAKLRVFAHNDLNDLERILRWADRRPATAAHGPRGHTLIVTESVFSMDGDQAPLRELVELKERFGAWLMLDEAHATGLLGSRRRGLAEECGVSDRVEIQMGTLGKALGSAGGFICGARVLID